MRVKFLPALAIGLVLLGGSIWVDTVLLRSIERQRDAAARFVPVEATVTRSELRTGRSSASGGDDPKPVVRYRYAYGGEAFGGARITFNSLRSWTSTGARRFVEEYPVGLVFEVYVDPDEPSVSVIRPDLAAVQPFLVLPLVPLHALGLLLTLTGGLAVFLPAYADPWRRAVVVDTPDLTVVRTPAMPLWAAWLVGLTGASVVTCGAVGVFRGLRTSADDVRLSLVLAVVAATAFAVWRFLVRGRPDRFVDIDRRRRTVTHPRGGPSVAIDSIADVVVADEGEDRPEATRRRRVVAVLRGDGGEFELADLIATGSGADDLADVLRVAIVGR